MKALQKLRQKKLCLILLKKSSAQAIDESLLDAIILLLQYAVAFDGKSFIIDKNEYGETLSETDRLGSVQNYRYDKEGRATENREYSGKIVKSIYNDNAGVATTEYTDGTRNVIVRDAAGRVLRAESPVGVIRYRYDAGGQLIRQQDEKALETTQYEYDAAGNRTRMVSGNRDVRYKYGKNNELLSVTDATQRLSVSYEYNTLGQETRRTYGNNVVQETLYDVIGRTELIIEWSTAGAGKNILRAEGYLYDEVGRRTHNIDEAGNVTKYEYDNLSRLKTVFYPWTDEKSAADKEEAADAGLAFTNDKGAQERYTFGNGEAALLRAMLDRVSINRGSGFAQIKFMWRESFTYDANGNRATKTTPWGTIIYGYDAENRLIAKGNIKYTYDKDGNLLSETGARKEASYTYNGQNRMASSKVTDKITGAQVTSEYEYDAYGRRTIVQDAGQSAMRTLYDGFTFDVIRENATFRDGTFTSNSITQTITQGIAGQETSIHGERYRYLGGTAEGVTEERARYLGGDAVPQNRYTGVSVTLYGNGEAVAVNRVSTGGGTRGGGVSYLGKDILGSVRSSSTQNAALENRYEYDAFGKPYSGDFSSGMSLGYTGKPYDQATGLYNYGYRDYQPLQARFTTMDPIRDGNNWLIYVNNDPINYLDPFGLQGIDISNILMLEPLSGGGGKSTLTTTTKPKNTAENIVFGVVEMGVGAVFFGGGIYAAAAINIKNPKIATTVGYDGVMFGSGIFALGLGRVSNAYQGTILDDIKSVINPPLGSIVADINKQNGNAVDGKTTTVAPHIATSATVNTKYR